MGKQIHLQLPHLVQIIITHQVYRYLHRPFLLVPLFLSIFMISEQIPKDLYDLKFDNGIAKHIRIRWSKAASESLSKKGQRQREIGKIIKLINLITL